jgi:hypothetical protein
VERALEAVRGSPGEVHAASEIMADIAGTTEYSGTTPHQTVGSVRPLAYSF